MDDQADARSNEKPSRRLTLPNGIGQQIRLWSGLILLVYAFLHFVNHALGIYSIEAMDAFLGIVGEFWESPVGAILLYGALIAHVVSAVWRIALRRTFKMPLWEALQIFLGILIPFQLILHIVAVRGIDRFFEINMDYEFVVRSLWASQALNQSLLLIIVWVHGVMGLHYWLRLRSWYRKIFVPAMIAAVLIPVLSMWGWVEAARRQVLMDPGYAQYPEGAYFFYLRVSNILLSVTYALIFIALLVVAWRFFVARYGKSVAISYPGGKKIFVRPNSGTLLEISRDHDIPHASVCGGRARCSTCRVMMTSGGEKLPGPVARERVVLDRIKADPGVRLACQIKPTHNMDVRPMVPVTNTGKDPSKVTDAYHWGVEQPIAIMFVDIRSFTSLSEKRFSYDVVFLLNRYFDVMTREIEAAGGYVDKFIGDGILAVFGVTTGLKEGSRNALDAAKRMGEALGPLNDELSTALDEPLEIGIGVHAGPAILGRVGAAGERSAGAAGITVLGDTVNTASRLEEMNKKFSSVLIVSDRLVRASGNGLKGASKETIDVRGRASGLKIHVVKTFADFEILDEFETTDRQVV